MAGSSQPLAFGELAAGGLLLAMGITGYPVRSVIKGNAKTVKPFKAAGAAGTGTAARGGASADTAFSPTITGGTGAAGRFVKWALTQQGVQEGTAQQARYAASAGLSPAQAWCAAFVTYGLRRLGLTPPAGPGAVSDWESWAGGEHVSGGLAAARPGDLLAFNGEHIGIYLGGGKMISGNWGNEVAIDSVSAESEPLTAIIRVKGLYRAAAAAAARRGVTHPLSLTGPARA